MSELNLSLQASENSTPVTFRYSGEMFEYGVGEIQVGETTAQISIVALCKIAELLKTLDTVDYLKKSSVLDKVKKTSILEKP
jgi:hypothetical protein